MTYVVMLWRNQSLEIAVHILHSMQIAGKDTRDGSTYRVKPIGIRGQTFRSTDPYIRVIVGGEALANLHVESVDIVAQKSNLKIILIVPLVLFVMQYYLCNNF